jgi:hypothetical protein
MAPELCHFSDNLDRINVVVHDQYATSPCNRSGRSFRRIGGRQIALLRRLRYYRQVNGKFTALAYSLAAALDPAAMHLDQARGHAEPDPEAAARPVQRSISLEEHLEKLRQEFGGDADAVVANGYHRLIAPALDGYGHLAARGGVLGGIIQDIGQYLFQTNGVGQQVYWNFRERQRERVVPLVEIVTDLFDGLVDHPG